MPPQRLNVAFDDKNLIQRRSPADRLAAERARDRELAERRLTLPDPAAAPNRAGKLSTLICSSLIGGDCVDDAEALRAGDTAGILGVTVKAPSTLGTFLRSFGWGNVRELDAIGRSALNKA